MKRTGRFPIAKVALALALPLAVFPPSAHAYLDPGIGSMILQLLAGAVFAGIMTCKLWWGYVKNLARRLAGRRKE